MHPSFLTILLLLTVPSLSSANPPCGSTLTGPNLLTAPQTCPGSGYTMASGSSLDCQGFTLTGPDPTPPATCNPQVPGCVTGHYGIRLNGVSQVTVRRCIVSRFERGLYLSDTTNALIQDSVFKLNTRYGAQLSGASSFGNLFQRNTYKKNGDEGIHISDLGAGVNTSDGDLAVLNVAEGFYLLAAHNLVLQNCLTQDNGSPGIYLKNSRGTVVSNCQMTNDNIQILNDLGFSWGVTKIKMAP